MNEASAFRSQPYESILTTVQKAVSTGTTQDIGVTNETVLRDKIERIIHGQNMRCLEVPELAELVNYIYHDMAGYSFITRENLFERKGFEEININAWNDVEVIYHGRRQKTEYSFLSPGHAKDILVRMFTKSGTPFNEAQPRATADIGGGIRITAHRTPLVDEEIGVTASIRKVNMSIATKDELIASGELTEEMFTFLLECLNRGVSVCISGETGSGKTTLAGCLLNELSDHLRIFTIEEGSREWNFIKKDEAGKTTNSVIHTKTRPSDNPTLNITQRDLVKDSLRFDPNVIAPGEARGDEALEIIAAANTGHTVITTTHANNTLAIPKRLMMLAKQASDVPADILYDMVCSAFPILVHLELGADKIRRVTEIRELLGYADGKTKSQMIYEFDVVENRYDGDKCLEVVGSFQRLHPISETLRRHLMKKGATSASLTPYVKSRKQEGVA